MKLIVENFSCIKNTEVDISRVNILIGPQASGKSVLSKLIYFFYCIKDLHSEQISSERNIEQFSTAIKEKFIAWFPIIAWGDEKFKISFESNKFKITISRVIYKGELGENLRITLSEGIKNIHTELVHSASLINSEIEKNDDFYIQYQIQRKINEEIQKRYSEIFGEDYIDSVTYIPAGRSFFTNLGRALMAFERANMLDPVTVEFGRTYSNFIQGNDALLRFIRKDSSSRFLTDIIGGDIINEKGDYYIKSPDGRSIPFHSLSSGQQELLPLLLTFGLLSRYKNNSSLFFIEEPEAHLFPNAQSKVIEGLAAYLNENKNRSIFITTHSPYVLSKINNLIKAGLIERTSKSKEQLSKLDQVVSKQKRIDPSHIRAYCIEDGVVSSIIDDDTKLINADYLDEISNQIGNQFSDLLNIQYTY
ncbi:AAA family ATPase [Comamonas sp. GB3 AK4-5]|uniref:AAA family ATPase n=1 Tax=Comamonas sp. GB3 AK4-5 TaxID=3231487 RepID=UPI00351E3CAA